MIILIVLPLDARALSSMKQKLHVLTAIALVVALINIVIKLLMHAQVKFNVIFKK